MQCFRNGQKMFNNILPKTQICILSRIVSNFNVSITVVVSNYLKKLLHTIIPTILSLKNS